jgi:hypothetical protein
MRSVADEMMTLRLVIPRWRRVVVGAWLRVLVLQEMLRPGSVDFYKVADRAARFVCRIKIDG